jgi:hypothetical protein
MRICRQCKEPKPSEQFGSDVRTRDGVSNRCMDCRFLPWRRTPSRNSLNSTGYLYVIKASNGLYKIGVASGVQARFAGIASMSPLPVELVHMHYAVGVTRIEIQLQERFKESHSHYEWFRLSESDLHLIAELYPYTERT